MVSLAEVLGAPPDPEAVQADLAAGFAQTFGIRFAAQGLGPAERALAAHLEPAFAAGAGAPPWGPRTFLFDTLTPWEASASVGG